MVKDVFDYVQLNEGVKMEDLPELFCEEEMKYLNEVFEEYAYMEVYSKTSVALIIEGSQKFLAKSFDDFEEMLAVFVEGVKSALNKGKD